MGLGSNEDGHCSTCDTSHLRPWGSNCLAYKEALVKCSDLNIDASEYKQYLDLNLVKYAKDLPENSGTNLDKKPLPPDQVKTLTDINLQQKKQIQSLLHQLADKTKGAPTPPAPVVIDQGQILQQIVQRLDRLENQHLGVAPLPQAPQATPARQPVNQGQMFTASGAVSAANQVSNQQQDSAAVTAMGQMADAMEQLSLSIDPSSGKKSGQLLRPEYQYCVLEKGMPLKSADASKLTINEYLYGMCLVMQHLVESKGEWISYFNHYRRMMKFFVGKRYVNSAYIGYDKEVVDCYLRNPAGGFNPADSLAIPTHFCSANEHEVQNARSRGQKRQKQGDYRSRNSQPGQNPPDDWPEEACYQYNTATCNGSCGKQHICGRCLIRGHRVNSCRVKLGEKN